MSLIDLLVGSANLAKTDWSWEFFVLHLLENWSKVLHEIGKGFSKSLRLNKKCHCGRVVKAPDLKSGGLCPRRFEPCRWRASIVQWLEFLPSKQVARVRFPVDALVSAISLVAMIPRCQRGGPGSIPGWRIFFITQYKFLTYLFLLLNEICSEGPVAQ